MVWSSLLIIRAFTSAQQSRRMDIFWSDSIRRSSSAAISVKAMLYSFSILVLYSSLLISRSLIFHSVYSESGNRVVTAYRSYKFPGHNHRIGLIRIFSSTASEVKSSRSKRGKYPRIELYRNISLAECSTHKDIFLSCGFHEDDYRRLLVRFPYLINFDIAQHITPKLNFFTQTIAKRSHSINELVEFPEFFSYDLEKVIAPRHAYLCNTERDDCCSNKNNDDKISDSITSTLRLDSPVANTLRPGLPLLKNGCANLKAILSAKDDEAFVSVVGGSATVDDYRMFKARFLQGGLSAARSCDVKLLELLLEHGWDPASDHDRDDRSVLMWAAAQGKHVDVLATVRLLVECGGQSVNHISRDGCSCIHWAATGGSLEVCKYLVEKGADPLLPNAEGTVPLHWAAGSGNFEVLKWLLDEQHSLLESRNVFGCTVAHFASSGGQLEMCKYLHDIRGADFLECNLHGHDPLTKAIAFKRNNVARWLLESVSGCQETVTQLRPWDDDCMKSLWQIAELVGNTEGVSLLNEFL